MKLVTGTYSDIGISRKNNQDGICILQAESGGQNICMAIVCDGMGGLSKGELASAVIINEFQGWFEEDFPSMLNRASLMNIIDIWKMKILDLSNQLKRYGRNNNLLLGTTFSGVLIIDDKFIWTHVGDSRIYHIGSNQIKQLTTDHTVIAREIRNGNMTQEEAKTSKLKGKLTQCIGASQVIEPESGTGVLKIGETLLLCSDGFYHKFSEKEIFKVQREKFKNDKEIDKYCFEQTKEVMNRNEKDNISVVIVRAG